MAQEKEDFGVPPPEWSTSRVLKFGTGHPVPNTAKYLTTIVENAGLDRYVWHYFLVPNT